MPQISEFFGIMIYMYYDDHYPAHFHAVYGNDEAIIDIKNCMVYEGSLKTKQKNLVLAWCEIHQNELMEDWNLAKNFHKLFKIEPLR